MRRPANATGGRHRLSRILPAAVARPAVRAVVVDKERARSEVLRQLRAWTVEGRPEACRNLVGEIVETSSIAEALAELSRDLENTILVASGYLHAELRDLVPEEIWSAAEIIVDGDEIIEGRRRRDNRGRGDLSDRLGHPEERRGDHPPSDRRLPQEAATPLGE
jgi:hypothetical protein